MEKLLVEATCNYCGQYHGKEVCKALLARNELLEKVYEAVKDLDSVCFALGNEYDLASDAIAAVEAQDE